MQIPKKLRQPIDVLIPFRGMGHRDNSETPPSI